MLGKNLFYLYFRYQTRLIMYNEVKPQLFLSCFTVVVVLVAVVNIVVVVLIIVVVDNEFGCGL